MAQIETIRRRGERWIVWHHSYTIDPRLVSPVYLPEMPEADIQVNLDIRLVLMAEPTPEEELADIETQITERRAELADLEAQILELTRETR